LQFVISFGKKILWLHLQSQFSLSQSAQGYLLACVVTAWQRLIAAAKTQSQLDKTRLP